jgi:hypothetical protein
VLNNQEIRRNHTTLMHNAIGVYLKLLTQSLRCSIFDFAFIGNDQWLLMTVHAFALAAYEFSQIAALPLPQALLALEIRDDN